LILGVNRFLKTYQVKKEESGPLPTHFAALTLRAATASALTQHLLTGWINYLFSYVTIEPNSTDERTAIPCSWFHGWEQSEQSIRQREVGVTNTRAISMKVEATRSTATFLLLSL